MVAAIARARVRKSEREREPESDATNARIDVMCFMYRGLLSTVRGTHRCASGRKVFDKRSAVLVQRPRAN